MVELNKDYSLTYPAINDFIDANSDLFNELYICVDYYTCGVYFMDGTTHEEVDYITITDMSKEKQFETIYCERDNFELIINFISELRKFKE